WTKIDSTRPWSNFSGAGYSRLGPPSIILAHFLFRRNSAMRRETVLLGLLGLSGYLPSGLYAQQSQPEIGKVDHDAVVVRYYATIDNVKYVYGVAPPVANVKPGNILEANSLDCFGNALQRPGDSFSLVKGDNPLTGPFFMEGAEPGDTLVVHILDLQVEGKQGVGTFGPGFGAANATHYTPV